MRGPIAPPNPGTWVRNRPVEVLRGYPVRSPKPNLNAMDPAPTQTLYLDNAATTPADPRVTAAFREYFEVEFGNPSSRHPLGVRAAEAVARARRQIARVLGAKAENVVFTAGGTEANNLGVIGAASARRAGLDAGRPAKVLCGATEHASVRASALALKAEGFLVEFMPLNNLGDLDLEAAAEMMDGDVVVVTHMLVNNEFGTRYPIEQLAQLARRKSPNAHVHIDAVQSLGKVDLTLTELGVDSLSVSGHKVHAPKGAGALIFVADARITRLVHGGGQEAGLRSGTENVPGIVALGEAVRLADENRGAFCATSLAICEYVETRLMAIPGAHRVSPGNPIDSILAIKLPGPPAEVWQHHLEARGVYVGVGSACQSMSSDVSPALAALGMDEDAARQVARISLSRMSTLTEAERAMEQLAAVHAELGELTG
jgi:cysteine desulfurase